MNGFEKQELETQGMMSKLFGSKPGHNALVEINNFLAESTAATELTEERSSAILSKTGEQNLTAAISNTAAVCTVR